MTLTVDTTEELSGEGRYLFFKAARAAKLKGPPDWSTRLDDYLYHGRKFPNIDDE